MLIILVIIYFFSFSPPVKAAEIPKKDAIDVIIDKLASCESSNRPLIINPRDRHGESIGLLQFRRETFREQMVKYKIVDTSEWEPADWENAIRDGELQRKIAKLMIRDGQINRWGCASKI